MATPTATVSVEATTKDGAIVECFGVYPNQIENLIGSIEKQTLEQFSKMADSHRYKIISHPVDNGPATPLAVQVGGDHYKKLAIQPIEYIHANNIPFPEGSVIKYVTRWRDKNGIADLEKAKHFIELLIELEKKEESMKPK